MPLPAGRKIKIGFLTERMLLGFGVDLVVHKTAIELVRQGFDVTVFCNRSDQTYKRAGYKIVEICTPLFKSPVKTERRVERMLERLNYEDIDLWIAETYPFFAATAVMKKPVIVVDHGVSSTRGFSFLKRAGFFTMAAMQNHLYFPRAQKIINISSFTRSLTPKKLRGRQTIIYNGADNYDPPKEESIRAFREKWNIGYDDLVLLYVGRLNHKDQPYKGTAELVRMYHKLKKRHPSVKLIMAGYGTNKDRKFLRKSGILPFVCAAPETIALLYSIADIYVSASHWEGFNLPLAEAGLFGVPAVVYNIGAHSEVLSKDAGFLAESETDFLKRIDYLLKNPGERQNMGACAKKNAARFLWKNAGEAYGEAIREIVGTPERKKLPYVKGLVDVITLNYNGKKYLDNLFASLKNQTYRDIKVTMVDNGSKDGSVEYVRDRHPWVSVIAARENLFFSRGNNKAVYQTNGEYIFFVNNDTVVNTNAVEKMVATLRQKGTVPVAAVAAKMLFFKDKKIIDSVGTVITENGSPFNRGIGQLDIGQYDKVEETFGACFGAVLLRRVTYEKAVGPLDNAYFGYFEDIDWCFRARVLGYKIFTCPEAIVYHDHSGTTKKQGYDWKYYLIQRNYLKTLIKNFEYGQVIQKTLWKIADLLYQTITPNKKKRVNFFLAIKIIGSTILHLPALLWQRFAIQKKRCIPDRKCFAFARTEAPAFDPVAYEPIYGLETLLMMFEKLKETNPDRLNLLIVAELEKLKRTRSELKREEWNRRASEIIHLLENYLGRDYVMKFTKGVTKETEK